MEKSTQFTSKDRKLLEEAPPMCASLQTAKKIHIVQPAICTNVETVVNYVETEEQDPSDVTCKICTVCGDLPGTIGRPKKKPKPVKREKTEEEKKKDFAKYWVKTFEMMETEEDAVQKLFGEELEGLQKAVTISVKDFREMSEKDKARFVKAAIKEMNSLLGKKTFTRLTKKAMPRQILAQWNQDKKIALKSCAHKETGLRNRGRLETQGKSHGLRQF